MNRIFYFLAGVGLAILFSAEAHPPCEEDTWSKRCEYLWAPDEDGNYNYIWVCR